MTADVETMPATAAYDAWHQAHEVDAEANSPWHEMVKARLDPTRDLTDRRILETGCGRGGFACWLARKALGRASVVAADFSPAAVEKARRFAIGQGITNVEWAVADIQALEPFSTEFDTVISCETIEHVPDPPLAVRQLARVLRPGGRLYLTTPNYISLMGLYRASCWLRGRPFDEGGQPICQLTMLPRTRAWVRAAGLRIVETHSVGHYLPVPGRIPPRLHWLEHPRMLMKWFGLHSLVVAEKPGASQP